MNEPAAAPRATLPAAQRLKSRHHFRAVYQRGRRAGGQWMTVVVLLRRPHLRRGELVPNGARVGLSVSKDHGGAVRRNKLKRILREAFRLERKHLPDVDVVLIPRQRDDLYPLADIRVELVQLVQRACEQKSSGRRPDRRREP